MGWYTNYKRKINKGIRSSVRVLQRNAGTAGTAFGGTVGFVAAGPAGAALGSYLGGLGGRKFGRDLAKSAVAEAAPEVGEHLKAVRSIIEDIDKSGAKLVGGQEIVPGVVFVSEDDGAVILSDQTVKPPRQVIVPKLSGSENEEEAKEALVTSLKTAAAAGAIGFGVKKVLGG